LGCVETARRQVAELGEELSGRFELRLCPGFVANVIANLLFLGFGKIGKFLAKPAFRFGIQPRQSLENLFSVGLLFGVGGTNPFIKEVWHSNATGAGRFVVLRNNHVAQGSNGSQLSLRERSRPGDDWMEQVRVRADTGYRWRRAET